MRNVREKLPSAHYLNEKRQGGDKPRPVHKMLLLSGAVHIQGSKNQKEFYLQVYGMIGLEFKEVSVIEEAYAKINLFLEVFGKREDGYHGIRSVMQTVSLHDTVNVRLSESGIKHDVQHPGA